MTGRVRQVSGHDVHFLTDKWEIAESAPGSIKEPGALSDTLAWSPAHAPSTAAAALRGAGVWSLDGPARDLDAVDWWYRAHFRAPRAEPDEEVWLCLDGLATIAEVWLNGERVLASESMFLEHECRVDRVLQEENDLAIAFRSLTTALKVRRPRPRWRVPMVDHQQLRWFRTTLLGRTPGWSPPAAPVGPWRGIRLERRRGVVFGDVRLRADSAGRLDVRCQLTGVAGASLLGADIVLEREGRDYSSVLTPTGQDGWVRGQITVPEVQRWWPHTHGEQPLYGARIRVRHAGGSSEASIGHVGFRSVRVATGGGDFSVHVNDVPVFCRGACWTPLDPVMLSATPEATGQVFDQVVSAGMNMLRVGGMMVYESDAFLDQCDARGVLLWQDFMFANMDYPDDETFALNASLEARQQLARLQGRPSLALLCGNGEGEQQAAMWGTPRERWSPALFHERLADVARDSCPDVPYWPSSAHGGTFPHLGSEGTTSYFGVGAYLRPVEDARRSEVRFASECLAFANVPEAQAMGALPDGHGSKVHLPSWKARTPRDLGAGWDFDDVRDHYLARMFRVDPLTVRYADHDRYLALSRVVTGEVMGAVFGEWRRSRSATRGGLIWFLRDLWPGAGWGVIDATGTPKAAWYYLRRTLAPVAVFLSDEGMNGVGVQVVNDLAAPLAGEMEVTLFRAGEVRVANGTRAITVAPHAAIELNAGMFFDEFLDLNYAHRFGPASHDLVVATLRDASGRMLGQAFHFVLGLPNTRERDVGLNAEAQDRADGTWDLVVRTRRFAQSVSIDVEGFSADDNHFHVPPGAERRIVLRNLALPEGSSARPKGTLQALNAEAPAIIAVAP